MRVTYSAFAAMLLLTASPSLSFAQIVIPYASGESAHVARLDHVVPVATVTRPDDPITLANPKPGADFVVGAAKVDIKDPAHPLIVFTISNLTTSPIPPSNVEVHVASVSEGEDGEPKVSLCGYTGVLLNMLRKSGSSALGNATLLPGATVTVTMPVGPYPCNLETQRPNVGFLVQLTGDGTHHFAGDDVPLLRRALEALRADGKW